MKNLVHLKRLPEPDVVKSQALHAEAFVTGAHEDRSMVNETVMGADKNGPAHNYVIGVAQRGTLQMLPKEFDDLLAAMIVVHRARHAADKKDS